MNWALPMNSILSLRNCPMIPIWQSALKSGRLQHLRPQTELQSLKRMSGKCSSVLIRGRLTGRVECSALLLKNVSSGLAPVRPPMFQTSVDTRRIPLPWRTSYIKPLPNVQRPKEHKDYRPIALTSVSSRSLPGCL